MGVEKRILKAGEGPEIVKGQLVTVHCTGFGKKGSCRKRFWSTRDAGQQPFRFRVGFGSVIKGWDEGVIGMQLGEIAFLQCTPDYGYGANGFPFWGIPPNSDLAFEVEVLRILNVHS
ncbi:peptidyl-prolyl cis-trans isomerase FKBP12-like isoform X2 [Ananas comosus]|uniref:peptidylprolyl isomerase n=1 Tax=Ananas comosus TaxID=4615 RepID=A0A6P5F1R1_ANACO|nr:peptidyl-prolyl cis-trans isomerase FKBP12-like isoform X2 [Ananas comosus]